MKLLFVGDVVGKPGRRILETRLPEIQKSHDVDFTVVNGENIAAGRGITPALSDDLLALGVDVITTGNHIWAQRDITGYLDKEPRLLRPDNFPADAPGAGVFHGRSRSGHAVIVINLQGRVFMQPIECPFRALDDILGGLDEPNAAILVDFHAEATSEKVGMGWYADGRVSAVLGTHTHVPTADARLMPAGTAYCTDVGMTGPYDSVIGTRPDLALNRFITARPTRFQVANGNARVACAVVDIDVDTGLARGIDTFLDPRTALHEREGEDHDIAGRIFDA